MTDAFRTERRIRSHGFRALAHPDADFITVWRMDDKMPDVERLREILPELDADAFEVNRTTKRVFVTYK